MVNEEYIRLRCVYSHDGEDCRAERTAEDRLYDAGCNKVCQQGMRMTDSEFIE